MQTIKAVIFDPVGSLAEFPAHCFEDIAARVYDLQDSAADSGSAAYWQLLDVMQASDRPLDPAAIALVEALERKAVDSVELYEDVGPALAELKGMGITLLLASSLSAAAVQRFLDRFSLAPFFAAVWSRDTAGGVKEAPIARAIERASLAPEHVMSLVDTTEAIEASKQVGVNSILMINDYDEGRKLAMQAPTGGIVSLHELPDAIRLVAVNANPRP